MSKEKNSDRPVSAAPEATDNKPATSSPATVKLPKTGVSMRYGTSINNVPRNIIKGQEGKGGKRKK